MYDRDRVNFTKHALRVTFSHGMVLSISFILYKLGVTLTFSYILVSGRTGTWFRLHFFEPSLDSGRGVCGEIRYQYYLPLLTFIGLL